MRETGFLNRTVVLGGASYRFQVYVPWSWTPERLWPVILFLHGGGERGDDGLRPTEVGLGSAIRRNARRFPAIVVFPQTNRSCCGWWGEASALAIRALDHAVAEFHGDPRRLYLTGLSMGGSGTFRIAAEYPGRFAALVPVCADFTGELSDSREWAGEGEHYQALARTIGRTPVWLFQGGVDDAPSPVVARRLAATLAQVSGDVRYTEYPGVGHNAWEWAYAEPGLMPWLLARTRGSA